MHSDRSRDLSQPGNAWHPPRDRFGHLLVNVAKPVHIEPYRSPAWTPESFRQALGKVRIELKSIPFGKKHADQIAYIRDLIPPSVRSHFDRRIRIAFDEGWDHETGRIIAEINATANDRRRGKDRPGFAVLAEESYLTDAATRCGSMADAFVQISMVELFKGVPGGDAIATQAFLEPFAIALSRRHQKLHTIEKRWIDHDRYGDLTPDEQTELSGQEEALKESLDDTHVKRREAMAAAHPDFTITTSEQVKERALLRMQAAMRARGTPYDFRTQQDVEEIDLPELKETKRILMRETIRGRGLICQRLNPWQKYAPPEALELYDDRQLQSKLFLETHYVTDGEEILSLAQVSSETVANPVNRYAEMLARIEGTTKDAIAHGLQPVLVTLTCPSRFHRSSTRVIGTGTTKREIKVPNPNWNDLGPDAANAWKNERWAKFQRTKTFKRLDITGVVFAESHVDGCPHWHAVLFTSDVAKLTRALRHYFLDHDNPTEPGAQQHRVNVDVVRPARPDEQFDDNGRPVPHDVQLVKVVQYYASKYCQKQVDSGVENAGEARLDGGSTTHKEAVRFISTWKQTWGIRSWNFINAGSATIWRELRRLAFGGQEKFDERMAGLDPNSALYRAAVAADDGDYQTYVAILKHEKIPITRPNGKISMVSPLKTTTELREKTERRIRDARTGELFEGIDPETGEIITGEKRDILVGESRRVIGITDLSTGAERRTREKDWTPCDPPADSAKPQDTCGSEMDPTDSRESYSQETKAPTGAQEPTNNSNGDHKKGIIKLPWMPTTDTIMLIYGIADTPNTTRFTKVSILSASNRQYYCKSMEIMSNEFQDAAD